MAHGIPPDAARGCSLRDLELLEAYAAARPR